MPAPALAILPVLMLAQPPGAGPSDILKVASAKKPECRVIVDGVCRVESSKAGDGGAGGNAVTNYYFYLGGAQAGNGGNGGSVKTNAKAAPMPAPIPTPQQAAPPSPPVSLTLSRCKLTIAGKTEVDAKACQYEKAGQQFSVVAPSENQKYTYTIKVALLEDKTGRGSLAGGKTSAVRDLGPLVRRGACWAREDGSVEICAWK